MESSFLFGSGFHAADMSLLIRSMIGSVFALWTLWVAYKQFQLVAGEQMEFGHYIFNVIKLTLLLVTVLVLVGT